MYIGLSEQTKVEWVSVLDTSPATRTYFPILHKDLGGAAPSLSVHLHALLTG